MRSTFRSALWVLFSLWLSAVACAQDAVLGRATQLLDKGDAQGAYQLLKPLESERAGNPDFDLLLGIAALETKRATEAVFALERVLAVRPNDARARAEIARAYFIVGERRTSELEFEQLRKRTDIPPEARATIEKYLDAIASERTRERTAVTAYTEITVGYDSNVNTAPQPGAGAVAVITPGVTPSTRTRDEFLAVGGGVAVRHAVNDRLAVIGNLDTSKRMNGTIDTVDTGIFNAALGVRYDYDDRNSYTVAFQGQEFYVDNKRFRTAYGPVAQYQRVLDPASALTLYAQHLTLDHVTAQEARNAERFVAGFGYGRALKGAWEPVIFAGAYGGAESERNACTPVSCFGHKLYGARLGGQVKPWRDVTLFAAGSAEQRDYDGPFPPSTGNRSDTQYDVRFGMNYIMLPQWTLTPALSYTQNRSNTAVFDFHRVQATLTVRREFK